jgi:hypothetical protein
MSLESSRRRLQLWFRPRPDRRSAPEVIVPQSCGTPILGDFTWESRDKKPFECHSHGVVQSILYGGRWWLPPSPDHGESWESRVARGLSFGCSRMGTNQLVGWFDARSSK